MTGLASSSSSDSVGAPGGPLQRTRITLLLLGASLLAPVAGADDLAGIYAKARMADPTYQVAGYQRQASGETVVQARSGLLPQVTFQYDRTNTRQDIVSADNEVFADGNTAFPTTTYTVSLNQPLVNIARFHRFRQAQAGERRADAEYATAGEELILRVADLYYTALAAQDNLDFFAAERASVEAQLTLAEERLNSGLGRITDLHDARARFATVQASIIEAENALDDSLRAIEEITGEPVGTLARLRDDIPLNAPEPADLQSWVDAAMRDNTEIANQLHAVEEARREFEMQKAGHYPTLDLALRRNRRDTEGTLFGGSSDVTTDEVTVQLNIPLYSGGFVSSRRREAAMLHQSAQLELSQIQRRVARNARAAYLGVVGAISKADSIQQTLAAQRLALEAKEQGYRSGLYSAMAVLDAERDLFEGLRDLAQARYEYLSNTLALKQVAGRLSEEDLQAASGLLQ